MNKRLKKLQIGDCWMAKHDVHKYPEYVEWDGGGHPVKQTAAGGWRFLIIGRLVTVTIDKDGNKSKSNVWVAAKDNMRVAGENTVYFDDFGNQLNPEDGNGFYLTNKSRGKHTGWLRSATAFIRPVMT